MYLFEKQGQRTLCPYLLGLTPPNNCSILFSISKLVYNSLKHPKTEELMLKRIYVSYFIYL